MQQFILLTIIGFIALASGAPPAPSESFKNSIVLVEPDKYILYWNYDKTDVTFEIQVKDAVWAAFGFSPNGGMANADVVVTFNHANGSNHFTDRHITKDVLFPVVDKKQDWFQLYSSNKNGYLVSKFKRKIKICDAADEDKDIVEGTPFSIFAWGSSLQNGDITYHFGSRGTKSLPILSSLNTGEIKLNMDEVEIAEFVVNTTISDQYHTEYYCQMFKIPNSWLAKKRHVLRYDTVITPGNENLVHHWTMNECGPEFETEYLKSNSMPEPGPCFEFHPSQKTIWPNLLKYCTQVSLVWAVGSPLVQDFPVDIAYPVGGKERDFTYFFMELHYDNPELKSNIKDKSGFKMIASTNYRQTEFGVFTVGSLGNWPSITVPPKQSSYATDFFCRSDCLDELTRSMPSKEITVFSTLPHAHLKGREIYTSVIRDGEEVDFLSNNKYFDFNYQYYNFLQNPVKLRQGDQLRTTCVYNSENDSNFTYAGFATTHEMCYSFVWYYPKNSLFHGCTDGIDLPEFKPFLKSLEKSGYLGINDIETGWPDMVDKQKSNLGPLFQDFIKTHSNRTQACVTRMNITTTTGLAPLRYSPKEEKCMLAL